MKKKSIEDNFSLEMDAYFNGIKEKSKLETKEYNELLQFGRTLVDEDFSKNSNKKAVFNKVLKNIDGYEGGNIMKKSNKFSRMGKVAASLAVVGVLSVSLAQTSFAQGVAEKIIKTINLGHIGAVQVEPSKAEKVEVPSEFKGKIFDKNGKPIDVVTKKDAGRIHTANGEEIAYFLDGKIVTVAEEKKARKKQVLEIKNPSEINKYTCFKVILPSYLPKDYKFNRAEFHKNDGQVKDSKFVDLWFVNEKTGKEIYMQQRAAMDDMKSVSGTDGKIEKAKVNGIDAIISDDRNIDWETKSALYSLSGNGNISKSELIKIAESIK